MTTSVSVNVGNNAASAGRSIPGIVRIDGDGGGARWRGFNTDGIGLVRDLQQRHGIALRGRRTLIIGAGGATRGILQPLIDAGCSDLQISNRTTTRAQALAQEFGVQAIATDALPSAAPFDLLIHASAAGHTHADLDWPAGLIAANGALVDLSYGRAAAPALRYAAASGALAIDGLGMLIEQAAEAFYLWFGVRPDTAPVYAALAPKQP